MIKTTLSDRTKIAQDVVDLGFTVEEPRGFQFRAGQFVTLAVGQDEAGQPVRRSYSIASVPAAGRAPSTHGVAPRLRFLIKVIPGGPGSDFFTELPLGAPVAMTGPHGFFTLDPQHPGDVVFAATGTGLAPVLPMLAELIDRNEPGRRLLFWGVRHRSDLFLMDEVQALCRDARADLQVFLSRPDPQWTGPSGHICGPLLDLVPTLNAPTFYLVGNGAMIRELKQGLVKLGLDRKKQIRTEAFFD